MSSDDNGQDLANYNFATDGFRVNPANPEVCTLYTHFMIFITIDLIKKVCQKILNQILGDRKSTAINEMEI